MDEFLSGLAAAAFLRRAVVAALLASVVCGVLGTLAVVRRSTYVAGAVSHSVLAGIGFARYAAVVWGWTWMTPRVGSMAAALVVAAILGSAAQRERVRGDTVLSIVWTVGMAVGLAFLAGVPGYKADLMNALFGNILLVTETDLVWMASFGVVAVAALAATWRWVLATCFHAGLARLRGVPVPAVETMLSVLEALAVVMLVKIVGVVLIIALLAIPAAAAGMMTRRLVPMMFVATGLSVFVTVGGLALAYAPDWPVGPTIVLLSTAVYGAVALAAHALRKKNASRTVR